MEVTVTERAATKIKDVFESRGMPEGTALRIGIKGGGCSGFSYTLDVAAEPAPDDEVCESGGIRVVCDPKSALFLSGTEIDYDDDLLKGGFVFNNPNAKQTCSCGASFST